MTDLDTLSAHARRLFDPSGWKERTYGDPTVRVLILLGSDACSFKRSAHLGRWGSLLALPRPVAEVADAVLAYEARLAALASPGPTNLFLPGPGGEFRPRRIS